MHTMLYKITNQLHLAPPLRGIHDACPLSPSFNPAYDTKYFFFFFLLCIKIIAEFYGKFLWHIYDPLSIFKCIATHLLRTTEIYCGIKIIKLKLSKLILKLSKILWNLLFCSLFFNNSWGNSVLILYYVSNHYFQAVIFVVDFFNICYRNLLWRL